MNASSSCYCGSTLAFSDCCDRYLSGHLFPDTAEKLMRSRYSAFATSNHQYLIDTCHPSRRQAGDIDELEAIAQSTKWLSLKIINKENGEPGDNLGFVEFAAFYHDRKSGLAQIHERSKFVLFDERWVYLEGVSLPNLKLTRNELCFCGSGKKFKKCHA